MKFLRVFILTKIILFSYSPILAQKRNVQINEPEIVKKLTSIKKSNNASTTLNDKYKIQVFHGKNLEATETLNRFKKLFPSIDTTIIYNSPSYKVMVGNFKTRLEAEKNLKEIQTYFDQALIIKPTR